MSTSPAGSRPPRLDIGDAIHDGWLAFSRSPWPFVGFALLLWLVQLLAQGLQNQVGSGSEISSSPVDWVLALIGLVIGVLGSLWGAVGLVRGAWSALDGGRPRLGELMRWDGSVAARVFKAWLLVALLVLGPLLAILLLLGGPLALLGNLGQGAAAAPGGLLKLLAVLLAVLLLTLLGLLFVATIYLTINQKFLTQIALLEGGGPVAVVQRGRRLVDPHWPLVFVLAVVEAALLLLGFLACFVGFFVAWPVVVCISTAAYRQLTDGLGLRQGSTA